MARHISRPFLTRHLTTRTQGAFLLSILLALVALTHTSLAQDTSKIPTLQLWFEAKGITHANYIERYDKQGGAANALIVRKNSRPLLWYLKNGTIDTSARPVPDCDPYWVGEADLNGDGVKEMIDWRANVFVRPSAGEPYGLQSVARYAETGKAFFYGNRTFIGDFDGDGKEDFIGGYRTQTMIARLLMGGNDLTKLRVIDVPRIPDPAYTLQYIVGAWRDGDGTNKMVVYQQLDTGAIEREEAFFLYSFRIEGDKVTYTPLDTTEIKVFKDKVTPYYFYESSFVWHSRDNKEHTLVAAYGQTDIYSIVTNTLQFRWTKRRREGSGHYLLGNTTDTISNGFVRGANPHLLLYSSNPVKDTNAHAKIPIFYKGQPYESVHAIGDINNDGFGDIAVVYGTEDFLTLYLGRSSVLSTVIDDTRTNITLNNNQPCSKSGVLTVRVSSVEEREIRLSLYSLNGAIAADMGTYPTSGGIVAIPLARYALSPGMYNLRCTIGTQVFDKGLIITE